MENKVKEKKFRFRMVLYYPKTDMYLYSAWSDTTQDEYIENIHAFYEITPMDRLTIEKENGDLVIVPKGILAESVITFERSKEKTDDGK